MAFWICTGRCRVLNQNFEAGDIKEYATNPNSSYFEAYEGEVESVEERRGHTNLKSTHFFGGESWDDLRFPATTLKRGATSKPDFDYTNIGLLFPQDTATEIVYAIAQLPHAWKIGSDLYPHVHYEQDEEEEPVFKLDYRWYESGGDPTGDFTTITASTFSTTYVEGSILQVVGFPAIRGSGITTLSSILEIKLYRDDDVVTGDVLVKEFDIHYQIDSPGSGRITQK